MQKKNSQPVNSFNRKQRSFTENRSLRFGFKRKSSSFSQFVFVSSKLQVLFKADTVENKELKSSFRLSSAALSSATSIETLSQGLKDLKWKSA